MNFSRRQLMSMAMGLSPMVLGGCLSGKLKYPEAKVCNLKPSKSIRIDMHCHLLNLHDLNEGRFIAERFANFDEGSLAAIENIAEALVSAIGSILEVTAWPIKKESGHLDSELKKLNRNPKNKPAWLSDQDFCFFASEYQAGVIKAEHSSNQITGVFSNRIRNAARMMALFREVNIFTPSMVDLFDEESKFLKTGKVDHDISTQIAFYSNLNLATNGRFLPLVSFNPARQFAMEKNDKKIKYDYLYWVEKAISKLGFIGVKVHPSSGFSPIDNLKYACFSADRSLKIPSDRELYERFTSYDNSMSRLFEICKKYDVPILTHNGDSISLNRSCMEGQFWDSELPYQHYFDKPIGQNGNRENGEWTYAFRGRKPKAVRPESEWTNSSASWIKAMEMADRKYSGKPLRVCLGHFANGFKDPDRRHKKENVENIDRSVWLKDAIAANNNSLYADVSIMNDLFDDKTKKQEARMGKHRMLFSQLLKEKNKFTSNIMYGTDWHMPSAAKIGKTYYTGMETIISAARGAEYSNKVMGGNAVRFFGLAKEDKTRKRLETFYKNAPDSNGTSRDGTQIEKYDKITRKPIYERDHRINPNSISWWSLT